MMETDSDKERWAEESGSDKGVCDTSAKPPSLSRQSITQLCRQLFALEVLHVKQLNSYDDRNYWVQSVDKLEFVLKVTNSTDTASPDLLEAQNAMMQYLDRNSFHVPSLMVTIDDEQISRRHLPIDNINSPIYAIRLFRFIPGIRLCEVSLDHQLLMDCGEYIARLDLTLQEFHNEVIRHRTYQWSLTSVPQLQKYLSVLGDEHKQAAVKRCIEEFEAVILNKWHLLEKSFIHGDLNEQNILVSDQPDLGGYRVHAILDFGDISYGPRVFDIAIFIAYLMLIKCTVDSIWEAPRWVLEGYKKHYSLNMSDLGAILVCAKARLAQSLTLGAHTHSQQPDNVYLLTTAKTGWQVLNTLCQVEDSRLLAHWSGELGSYTDHSVRQSSH